MAQKRKKIPPTEFGRRLDHAVRQVFGEQGQTRAAAAMGMPPQQLNKYVMGRNEPLLDVLVRIANGLGVSLDWLVTGDGPMRRDHAHWRSLPGWLQDLLTNVDRVPPSQHDLLLQCVRLVSSDHQEILPTLQAFTAMLERQWLRAAVMAVPVIAAMTHC